VEDEEIHFFHGLISRPFFEGHAISGNENAGAIVTETAMHENLCPGSLSNKERNWTTCSSVGGDQPLTGMWTKRMPSDSARLRSQATFSRFSPRRSTMVVMPNIFNSERPTSLGCAPRYRTSVTFPALGIPARCNFCPWADGK